MSENIIVAFIGAGAVIVAAIVALIGKCKRNSELEGKTTIKQSVKGNYSVQIGIQNNSSNDKEGNRL